MVSRTALSRLLILIFLFTSQVLSGQIKVFERNVPTEKGSSLFFNSDIRKKIDLNGEWEVSFGGSYQKFFIPMCYDYKGEAHFKRTFSVPSELLSKIFIFCAEGISYESVITINGKHITANRGGYKPFKIELEPGIIQQQNTIDIIVKNDFSRQSIPLPNFPGMQHDFGGINRDIYLYTADNIYISDISLKYQIQSSNVQVSSKLNLRNTTSNALQTSIRAIIRNNKDSSIINAPLLKANLEPSKYNSIDYIFSIANPALWEIASDTSGIPALYSISFEIVNDSLTAPLDQTIIETGFRDFKLSRNGFLLNGKENNFRGINYYEYAEKFGSALDYNTVYEDVKKIKSLGVNTIRSAQRSPHPYLVSSCSRLGMLLFAEIPFTGVPKEIAENETYTGESLEYLRSVVNSFCNYPSIAAWGIGNNFDVTSIGNEQYVKDAAAMVKSIDDRPVYYSTQNIYGDICEKHVTFKGIDIFEKDSLTIKKITAEYTSPSSVSRRNNVNLFISSFGKRIVNTNENGYSDINSRQYQSKYLYDIYGILKNKFSGAFIESYNDFYNTRALLYQRNENHNLFTSGIYEVSRKEKPAVVNVIKMFKGEESQKLPEGSSSSDKSYIFILAGVVFSILLVFLITNIKRIRDSFWRALYRPSNFFQFASEQYLIPVFMNVFMSLMISLGIGLYAAAIVYIYRDSLHAEMIISGTFYSESLKIFISSISDNPGLSIAFYTLCNFLLHLCLSIFIYIFSFFIRGRVFFKNLYTITVWSALPLLLFLPIGTVIYKLGSENSEFVYLSAILLGILHILFVYRLIKGLNEAFDVPTLKMYVYAFSFILLFYGGLYIWLSYFRETFLMINLVKSYLAN